MPFTKSCTIGIAHHFDTQELAKYGMEKIKTFGFSSWNDHTRPRSQQ
jgi:hypothetical protein